MDLHDFNDTTSIHDPVSPIVLQLTSVGVNCTIKKIMVMMLTGPLALPIFEF